MSKIAEIKALEAYPIAYYRNGGGIDDANASDRAVYEEGYDQSMKDFLDKVIIAYCEVCKMPNCVMQNQKEICPYLSKFRGRIKSLLDD